MKKYIWKKSWSNKLHQPVNHFKQNTFQKQIDNNSSSGMI